MAKTELDGRVRVTVEIFSHGSGNDKPDIVVRHVKYMGGSYTDEAVGDAIGSCAASILSDPRAFTVQRLLLEFLNRLPFEFTRHIAELCDSFKAGKHDQSDGGKAFDNWMCSRLFGDNKTVDPRQGF
jgi:hypothetical protein